MQGRGAGDSKGWAEGASLEDGSTCPSHQQHCWACQKTPDPRQTFPPPSVMQQHAWSIYAWWSVWIPLPIIPPEAKASWWHCRNHQQQQAGTIGNEQEGLLCRTWVEHCSCQHVQVISGACWLVWAKADLPMTESDMCDELNSCGVAH